MNITAATKLLAVIGDPVRHSLSPVMHNGWIADHGLDAVYVALPLKSDDPVAAIRTLKGLGFTGLNVTVPHKEAAALAADRTEQAVANVLRWENDGALSAFNTDGAGFIDALAETAPDWRARVKRVLVLGAGGAGLGIGQALAPHVDTVHFANRTISRAEAAAATLPNGRVLRWDELERGFGAADLIVQATTLGMSGQATQDWPIANVRGSAILADIVYRPLETEFLRAGRARGLVTMDGLGMLIHQGARAFELWFGVKPDAKKARARLLAALGA
ncbi:MAG: shikimate dehydrogenase [Caulobacterales bacterium]|jgi:shikimate dehydrogenase|nr:shikimate dehydrogenase [Caulobacterales bacterium]